MIPSIIFFILVVLSGTYNVTEAFFAQTRKTHYDTLQLTSSANIDEIKQSYRNLAKKYHPDKNMDHPEEAQKTFMEVAKAYEVLSDEDSRREYDFSIGLGRPAGFKRHVINHEIMDEDIFTGAEDFVSFQSAGGSFQFRFQSTRPGDPIIDTSQLPWWVQLIIMVIPYVSALMPILGPLCFIFHVWLFLWCCCSTKEKKKSD